VVQSCQIVFWLNFVTWLFDQIQLISEPIYGEVTLVPDWENTGLLIPTGEVFGVVPLFDEKAVRESVEEAEESVDDVDVNDMLDSNFQPSPSKRRSERAKAF
jgi:hypothetical protein